VKMGVPEKDFPAFKREVNQHLRQGTLVRLKKNRLCLPRDADLITGFIRFRQSGSATLFPDPVEGADERSPYPVRAEDTGVAMHGDRVVARIHHDRRRFRKQRERGRAGGREEGETVRVIRILERANKTMTGTLKRSKMFFYVIPDDPRIIQDILVPDPKTSSLRPKPRVGDKVVVQLAPWEQRHLNPEGKIKEVLGKTHTPKAEFSAILRQHGLRMDFPSSVLREVEKFSEKVQAKDRKGRRDLRKLFTVTIDPQDAKDFDDALSLESLPGGGKRIGVHIADVGHYVRSGTALDREARRRGNSTYLVGTVIPMLPGTLSNGLCSLVEGEDRLTKSVFLSFDKSGKLRKTEFADTVINSNKRLTYEQAYAFLFEKDVTKIAAWPDPPAHQTGSTGRSLKTLSGQELKGLRDSLRSLWETASRLRTARLRKGSLELDMPETKIYVDEEGYADRIVRVEQDESHQMIEEFMLAANEAVARSLNRRNLPAIHRVHDKPDPEKLDEFADHLESFGIQAGDLNTRANVNRALRKVREHPQAHALRVSFLRSLKQACYRASPDGHYGLAKEHYTHFTSPIRRYSDLVVHRVFSRHLVSGDPHPPRKRYTASELASMAQHLSITEQNSTEAERESVKVKLLEFFERELTRRKPRTFDAVIMDVRNHGMFVELSESMAYGLVHISTLRDDLYKLQPSQNAIVGRKRKRRYAVGDTIPVQVARVDRFKRQIDFKVAGGT
ncbi:MAG: RNB domain-containing ribonuclease, partial [Verrucomicrobia bacterium]|nr:RNB domain-containing ribonuclease [Verrucomicrobiota bacterium]